MPPPAPFAGIDAGALVALAQGFSGALLFEASRYLAGAVLVWLLLHVLLRRRLTPRLIGRWPSRADMRREMLYSLTSTLVFAGMGLVVFALVRSGHMEIYGHADAHGRWWLWLSLPALIVWHDLFFYWTHRALHTGWLFRHVHRVHHRSHHPSPWAAYAFHPVEAFINGLVVPLALLVVPLHGGVLFLFGVHQILRNAHGHAAVETLPVGFVRHGLGRWITTTTHHHLHHETGRGHYGLWFTWWDRWCGTERADYAQRFDAVTGAAARLPVRTRSS
jgi:sterol desaturase/sphingolipid hydroxylase (fatty acid hydroxylase superfamily)